MRSRRIIAGAAAGALASFGLLAVAAPANAATVSFTEPGASSFQVPDGVTAIHVSLVGGGGAGGQASGGAGCQVSATLEGLTSGETIPFFIGAGGASGDGSGGGGASTEFSPADAGLHMVAGGGGGGANLGDTTDAIGGSGCAADTAAGGAGANFSDTNDGDADGGAGGATGTGGTAGGGTSPGNNGTDGDSGSGGNGTGGNGGAGDGDGDGGNALAGGGGGGGYGGGGGGGGNGEFGAGGGAGGSLGPIGAEFISDDNQGDAFTNGGNGLVAISWDAPDAPGPIFFDPEPATFGNVLVGDTKTKIVTAVNAGGSPVTPTAITPVGNGVSVTGGSCAVSTPIPEDGGTCTLELAWTPTSAGLMTAGTITVAYSGGVAANNVLELHGYAATPVAGPLEFNAEPVTFGALTLGDSSTKTVTVENSGNVAATPTSIATTNAGVDVTGGTCAVATPIAPAASCTVQLTWSPSTTGSLPGSAALAITYSGPGGGTSNVDLTGTASAAPNVTGAAPSKPQRVKVTGKLKAKTFKVRWAEPTTGTATSYRIEVKKPGKKTALIRKTISTNTLSANLSRSTLLSKLRKIGAGSAKSRTKLRVTILAINAAGESQPVVLTFHIKR